uniref:Uncharacterized protein n=1 Tax=Romanomermis culicivorax TaxID=13658 RepID=A0A915HNX4_ROMCU
MIMIFIIKRIAVAWTLLSFGKLFCELRDDKNNFVSHVITGRIFCDEKPVYGSHVVYADFSNKTRRFWASVVHSFPNGTFVLQHFVPSSALSISQRNYLTIRTSACSETGRVLKFENITSSKNDLGRLNFVNPNMMPEKVSYQLTGRALCCKAPMQNKQVIIEMLEASTGSVIWSKTVSTNDNGHFNTSVKIVENRNKKFDFEISPIGCSRQSRILYRKLLQENKNFDDVKFTIKLFVGNVNWSGFSFVNVCTNAK